MLTKNAQNLLNRQTEICILQQQIIDCMKAQEKTFKEEATSGSPMMMAMAFMVQQNRESYEKMLDSMNRNVDTFKRLVEISKMKDE